MYVATSESMQKCVSPVKSKAWFWKQHVAVGYIIVNREAKPTGGTDWRGSTRRIIF